MNLSFDPQYKVAKTGCVSERDSRRRWAERGGRQVWYWGKRKVCGRTGFRAFLSGRDRENVTTENDLNQTKYVPMKHSWCSLSLVQVYFEWLKSFEYFSTSIKEEKWRVLAFMMNFQVLCQKMQFGFVFLDQKPTLSASVAQRQPLETHTVNHQLHWSRKEAKRQHQDSWTLLKIDKSVGLGRQLEFLQHVAKPTYRPDTPQMHRSMWHWRKWRKRLSRRGISTDE